jgi:hypothetical protein
MADYSADLLKALRHRDLEAKLAEHLRGVRPENIVHIEYLVIPGDPGIAEEQLWTACVTLHEQPDKSPDTYTVKLIAELIPQGLQKRIEDDLRGVARLDIVHMQYAVVPREETDTGTDEERQYTALLVTRNTHQVAA